MPIPADSGWYHIVFLVSNFGKGASSVNKIYINGILQETQTVATNTTHDIPNYVSYIGRCNYAGIPDRHFQGYIDEFYMYKRELSQLEIMTLFMREY